MAEPVTVFAVPGNEALAQDLANALNGEQGDMVVRQFPDGETYVRGNSRCQGNDAVIAANLFQPNPTFLPLIYSIRAVRDMGAKRIVLATPYLPYMRQDARFQPGEVITSRIFANLLSDELDGLVTVDPHLHRYAALSDIYSIPTCLGHAAPALASWINDHVEEPLIIGPDMESEQWVAEVGGLAGAPYTTLTKTRYGDRDVAISVPALDRWNDHTPVLVDDIISTARTMVEAVGHLLRAGFSAPVCVGVHAIFADGAYADLKDAGASTVATCNTVEHESNAIDINRIVADSIAVLLASEDSANESTGK